MNKYIIIGIIFIIIGILTGPYLIWSFGSVKEQKKWYQEDYFNKEIQGTILSIHYFNVYPTRPVLGVYNWIDSVEITYTFYCDEDLELRNFISIKDSVYKQKGSKEIWFIKPNKSVFKKVLESCPDYI